MYKKSPVEDTDMYIRLFTVLFLFSEDKLSLYLRSADLKIFKFCSQCQCELLNLSCI
eukprot:GAHX01006212.1.p2 GENE.GAHX01006212.1~~GAHX01006212.1.p2  ORF type:complete len:57 (-),score=1.26 GAHX01006212.1:25-195(-)